MRIVLTTAALLLSVLAAPAQADDRFTKMDANADGQVNWEEFQAAIPNMKRPAFDAIDADKNGSLSHEEWDTFRAGHASMRQQGMPAGQMPQKALPQTDQKPVIRPPQ